ncbi:MAG: hypothetical protein GEU83_06640 [Pseudonocardiaceae bacterium]|nr:hypothetical protein [Pseudonocardiaceae bacterium]
MGNADEFFRRMGIPRHEERDEENSDTAADNPGSMITDLEELRHDAENLQRLFSAGYAPAAQHRGQNGTHAVRVTVGGDGNVSDVEIDQSWRRTVGEQGLSAAVLEAVTDATMRRLAQWAEAVASEQSHSAQPNEGAGSGELTTTGPVRPPGLSDNAEARRTVQEVLSLLKNVEAELDDLEREVKRRGQQHVVGRSPSHLVKVTMAGRGQVVDVNIQRRLMQRADERLLARELTKAFHAAYERADALKLDGFLGDGKLSRLQDLAADPNALLRRLGLNPR